MFPIQAKGRDDLSQMLCLYRGWGGGRPQQQPMPATNQDHPIVPVTNQDHPAVPATNQDHPAAPASNQDHPAVAHRLLSLPSEVCTSESWGIAEAIDKDTEAE